MNLGPSNLSERRQRRSNVPGVATQFFLEHLAGQLGCEAITLSSHDGLLIGGVGDGYDHDLLGALASLGTQIGSYEPDLQQAARGQALRFYTLDVHGSPMHISCVGGAPLPVELCTAALRRIHAVYLAA